MIQSCQPVWNFPYFLWILHICKIWLHKFGLKIRKLGSVNSVTQSTAARTKLTCNQCGIAVMDSKSVKICGLSCLISNTWDSPPEFPLGLLYAHGSYQSNRGRSHNECFESDMEQMKGYGKFTQNMENTGGKMEAGSSDDKASYETPGLGSLIRIMGPVSVLRQSLHVRESHYKDKTISQLFHQYLYNGNSCIRRTYKESTSYAVSEHIAPLVWTFSVFFETCTNS